MGESHNKTLIFVETKRKADELQRRMQHDGSVFVQQNVAVLSIETILCLLLYV